MKVCHALVWVVCLTLGVNAAQHLRPGSQAVRSASGQFSVVPGEATRSRSSAAFFAESGLLHLEPSFLTISAERLRQHLTRELQDTSPWESRILFSLRGTVSFEAQPEVVLERLHNDWRYHVSLPDYMEHDRFVRALVEINLMEIANRTSAGRAAEIPAWLTEGLTAHLLVSRSIEIILPEPKLELRKINITPWVVEEVNYQPLALAHAQLQTNTPLSIEQLSWPVPGTFEGRRGVAYRHCSQLLVSRLLQLPDGPARINAFIRNLGRHYNWQVAFLEAYHAEFPSLLDVEKWWALQVAHFTGRELNAIYPHHDSVLRLHQVVRFPVEVRLATSTLPMHGDVRLQTIIVEWGANEQQFALQQTLADLALLRSRIAPELIPLLDEYRLTLHGYLRNRNRTGIYLPKGTNRQASLTILIRRTLKKLDQLDVELAGLLPQPSEPTAMLDSSG